MINVESILMCVLLTGLGQLSHLGMVKIPSMKQKGVAANHPFSFKQWFSDDWTYLLSVFTFSIGVEIIIDNFAGAKPNYDLYKWAAYFFWGFMLSSIVQKKYSVYEKKVETLIDVKTNIADMVSSKVDASPSGVVVVTEQEVQNVNPTTKP